MGVRIRLERRGEVPLYIYILAPLGAFLLAFLVGAFLMRWAGASPIRGYGAFLKGAFGGLKPFTNTLLRATPFLLMATGISLSNRSNVLNIGAEGQYIMGAIAMTWVAVLMQSHVPGFVVILVGVILAVIVGAIWAGIAGYLKAKMGINEVVVTVMLNWVAIMLLKWLLRGPLKDPRSQQWPMSPPIGPHLPYIYGNLNLGFVIAVILAIATWFILFRTNIGFKLRACGENPKAARYAGFNVEGMLVLSMLISGGMAGMAGAFDVIGTFHILYEGIVVGLGYTSIIVALVGKNHPLAVIGSAIMFGAIYNGATSMQSVTQLSYTLSKCIEGMIYLFFLISEFLVLYRIKIVRGDAS